MRKSYKSAIAHRKALVAKFEADSAAGKFIYNDPAYHAKNIDAIKQHIANLEAK